MKLPAARRIGAAYVALQLLIWAKCTAFFLFYGHGKAMLFSAASFPEGVLFYDWLFHELMHVSIGVLALLYGKNLSEFRVRRVLPRILLAVFIHNLFYWLTATHPSTLYSVLDFGSDSIILLSAVFAGFLLGKWDKVSKISVPLIEK